MPNINLIAERREEKKKLERLTRQLFFGFAGSVGGLLVLSTVLGAQRLTMSSELRYAEAKMQKLQPTIDKITETEKDTNALAPKVETLETARTNTQRWRAVLQVVSQSVSESTWLSGLTATGTEGDTTINLAGMSSSQSQVGDTMTRLNAHPMFDKVDLKFTQTSPPTPADPTQRVTFEIAAHLRGIAPTPEASPAPGDKPAEQKAARAETTKEGTRNG